MKLATELATEPGLPEEWKALLELSIREVFEIMLGCKLDAPTEAEPAPSEFTAMVGLAGPLTGVLSLRCSARAAALMASRMLGVDPQQTGEEMWDAIGEVCNMVAGNFKNKLTGLADRCLLSVPTVITGSDFSLHSLADAKPLDVEFRFDGQTVLVTLEIHT